MLGMLHKYLVAIRGQVLPKSEAGQAVAYTLKNWTALTRYCSDGDLSIDNNATERSLRSFAVGRNYARAVIMCSPAVVDRGLSFAGRVFALVEICRAGH